MKIPSKAFRPRENSFVPSRSVGSSPVINPEARHRRGPGERIDESIRADLKLVGNYVAREIP